MKLYRDLQQNERLQAGDEQLHNDGAEWVAVETVWIGRPVPEDLQGCFRRPVDLPTLQRVTPEAMADLEEREAVGVLFINGYDTKVASYNSRGWWWCGGMGGRVDRPTRGWFIELATLKEVQ